MSITMTKYEHIVLSAMGVPTIAGTTMKVIELIVPHMAYGWSPEELAFQFPTLSLGQIYSALAYYWDHKDALDADITQRLRMIDSLRANTRKTSLHAKLKVQGLREWR
jgi:uncharacterized protein (DUF433 family)